MTTRATSPRGPTLALLAVGVALSSAVAAAQSRSMDPGIEATSPVRSVVELFTSQGCSSCPPADALFKTYADSKDIVALSFAVDYWDYLGWKDTLASPKHTDRQRAYAKARGDGAVYTPQIVVNGVQHAMGASPGDIDRAIQLTKARFAAARVPVRLWNEPSSLIVEVGDAPAGADVMQASIWLAVVQKTAEVPVQRGENGGKTLTYYNVVRELSPVGTFNGRAQIIRIARDAIQRPQTERLAVLIQNGAGGPIIGAAWIGM